MLHKPHHGALSQRFQGEDGKEYVSILTRKHRAFAAACLELMTEADGRERRWMLQHSAVTVPVELLGKARARLEQSGESTDGCDDPVRRGSVLS